jgi:hypothetical protein
MTLQLPYDCDAFVEEGQRGQYGLQRVRINFLLLRSFILTLPLHRCSLCYKLHGSARPISMKSDMIQKRSRHDARVTYSSHTPAPLEHSFDTPPKVKCFPPPRVSPSIPASHPSAYGHPIRAHERQSSLDSTRPTYPKGKHQTRSQSYVSAMSNFNANDMLLRYLLIETVTQFWYDSRYSGFGRRIHMGRGQWLCSMVCREDDSSYLFSSSNKSKLLCPRP